MPRRLALASTVALAVACAEGVAPPPHDPARADLPNVGHLDAVQNVEPQAASPEGDVVVPVEQDDPVWGSRTAPVTIVEFSDFQCQFCSRASTTVSALEEKYGPDKLRVVFKNFPLSFHPNARPAAEAGAAVRALGGDVAFWRFHKLAFGHQADLSPERYEAWARESGVNVIAFRETVAGAGPGRAVDRDLETGKQLGVSGTPAFYVNGVELVGAQKQEKFEAIIDAQLSAADALVAKGTPRDALYRSLASANYRPGGSADDDDEDPPDTNTWKVPVAGSPSRGAKTALVTIVEFSDFQCPFCMKVEPTLAAVLAAYGDSVRIVWKNEPLPFHPRALPAAMLALEARAQKGDSGFWAAHDDLFASQPHLDDADLDEVAKKEGLDLAKVRAAIAQKKYQAAVNEDDDLSQDVLANGTPHFFINGRRLVGAQPLDKFKAVIDEQLGKARALVAAGIKPEDVYAETMKTAHSEPPVKMALTPAAGAPSRGNAAAPVTIVEYADFECPYCRKADDTLAEVAKAYPTKVKIEWHDMPLSMHPHAHLAAEAARAVYRLKGKDAFWKFHDALFLSRAPRAAGSSEMNDPTAIERAGLEKLAAATGVDMAKFRAALDGHTYAGEIDADAKVASDAGINGTPAFLVNGYPLSGAQGFGRFRRLIDLSLREGAKKP